MRNLFERVKPFIQKGFSYDLPCGHYTDVRFGANGSIQCVLCGKIHHDIHPNIISNADIVKKMFDEYEPKQQKAKYRRLFYTS